MILSPPHFGSGDTGGSSSPAGTGSGSDQGGFGAPSGYRRLWFRIRGVAPLVMHSSRLANPLDPIVREMRKITGKRKKTEADHEQLARLEWYGGLWLFGGVPCLPGEAVEAGFIQAAQKSRRGAQAKAGMLSDGFWPLEYDGPKDPDQMWAEPRHRFAAGVRVQRNRVMRTRPVFPVWESRVAVDYLADQLDESDIREIMATFGRVIGIGDWRPRFGRFEVVGAE